jgi:hypothetical protein
MGRQQEETGIRSLLDIADAKKYSSTYHVAQ